MKVFNLKNMSSEQKSDMYAFLERKLVEQAVRQHMEKDKTLKLKGGVERWEIEENECLLVEYKNGEVWQYRNIDCGADDMICNLVQGGQS